MISEVKALKAEDYTEDSYKVLQDAITVAELLMKNDNTTVKEIEDAKKAILDAKDSLITKEAQANLDTAIEKVETLELEIKKDLSLQENFESAEKALKLSEEAISKVPKGMKGLEDLTERFEKAKKVIEEAKELVNLKIKLAEKIAEGRQYKQEEYVRSTWDKLNSVLNKADKVIKDIGSTKEQLQEQIDFVNEAIKNLKVPAPDFTQETIEVSKGISKGTARLTLKNAQPGLTYYVAAYFGTTSDAPVFGAKYEGTFKDKFNIELKENVTTVIKPTINGDAGIIAVDKEGNIVGFHKEFIWYYMVP